MDSAECNKEISKVITQLTAAIQNVGMYPHDHPQIVSYIQEAHDCLGALLKTKRDITIILIGEYLMADNRPLIIAGTYKAAFARILKKCSIERITFLRGLPLAELEQLIRNLASSSVFSMRSTRYIKTGKLKLKDGDEDGVMGGLDIELSAKDIAVTLDLRFQSPDQGIQNIYPNIMNNNYVNLDRVDEIVFCFMENMSKESKPLNLLVEIKSNNEYTYVHAANVGILTMFLAEYIGFEGSHLKEIGVAAILHDVGKVTIPDEILLKPGMLTYDERTVMENHPVVGAMRLMEMKGISNLAVIVAMEHHIKFNGSGYPRIRGGWKANIVSQMITVADVFDALRTNRPYRGPIPQDHIAQVLIKESGTTFNPYLVKHFLNLIDK
jgi:HD-GYP domain-containing protein (c-di-GMP phosphodiesterase class II)